MHSRCRIDSMIIIDNVETLSTLCSGAEAALPALAIGFQLYRVAVLNCHVKLGDAFAEWSNPVQ